MQGSDSDPLRETEDRERREGQSSPGRLEDKPRGPKTYEKGLVQQFRFTERAGKRRRDWTKEIDRRFLK